MTALSSGRVARWVGLGLMVVALAVAYAIVVGMPEVDLWRALDDPTSWHSRVFWRLQIPRIAQGLCCGAVLAVSGAALQGLLKNPLADPFILGVSGGAALGSAAVTLLGLGATLIAPVGGFIGALAALMLVTALAAERGHISPLRVLLIGVIVNALAGAALMVLNAIADPGAVQLTVMRLMGSVGADPSQPALMPIVVGAAVIALGGGMVYARRLDILALGDETARSLGAAPDRMRLVLFVLLSLPIGAVVAVTGLIGFVGLIVPHAVRLCVGPGHRLVIPLSALVGGAFVVVADASVSGLAPAMGTELPVGVVTALVGGPVFLLLLRVRPARMA